MAVDISGILGTSVSTKQSGKTDTNNVSVADPKSGSTTPNSNSGATSADSITISQQAEQLRVIDLNVNSQSDSDVDNARVEDLKSVIDAGRYDIDPTRVAEKLIELEAQFVA